MVIQCSSCDARFKLADDKVKAAGTKVRCAKCQKVFVVYPPTAEVAEPPVPDTAPTPSSVDEEFSFDIGQISASVAPPAEPLPAAEPPIPAVSTKQNSVFPEDAVFSGQAGESADHTAAFTFPEVDFAAVSLQTQDTAPASSSAPDDQAFSFNDQGESPAIDLHAAGTSPPPPNDAFDFETSPALSDGSSVELPSVKTSAGEGFSFDSSTELGFGELSFDEKPQDAPAEPNREESSFGQGKNDDLSWDDTPSPASTQKEPEAFPEAATDFDFSNISFESEPPSQTPPPALFEEEAPTKRETAPPVPTTPAPPLVSPPMQPAETQAAGPKRTAHHKRPSRSQPKKKPFPLGLIIKSILLLLIIGGAGTGYLYREQLQNAYRSLIDRYIEQQAPTEAQGQITIVNQSGSYLPNRIDGDLLILRGEARNDYPTVRSSIKVRGVIYGANESVLQTEEAYCGNTPNDKILTNSSFSSIKEILANELGDSLTNMNIAPGKTIPCTVVFKNPPSKLSGVAMDYLESKPGSK